VADFPAPLKAEIVPTGKKLKIKSLPPSMMPGRTMMVHELYCGASKPGLEGR
jgi:hypothetical protein